MAGMGTEQSPFEVATIDDLQKVGSGTDGWDLDCYYVQVADIDASETAEWNDGEGFVPIGLPDGFTGSYDGQGYTINDLTINRPSSDDQALFRQVGYATIANVHLRDVVVNGNERVAALSVSVTASTVSNCTVTGTVMAVKHAAGFIRYGSGMMEDTHIIDCWFNGSVLTSSKDSGTNFNSGFIASLSAYDSSVYVTNCYSVGILDSAGTRGGLVARAMASAVIENCYASVVIYSPLSGEPGGLIGLLDPFANPPATVSASFYDKEVSGKSDLGKGTPLTTAEMMDIDTYLDAGWDICTKEEFDLNNPTTWWIDNGNDYPRLWYEFEESIPHAFGASTTGITVSTQGAGQKSTKGQSEIAVAVSAEGAYKRYSQGASEASVRVVSEGTSTAGQAGAAETTIDVVAEIDAVKVAKAAPVLHGAVANFRLSLYEPVTDGIVNPVLHVIDVSAAVTVLSEATEAMKVGQGASETLVSLDAEGAGMAIAIGAGETAIAVDTDGAGLKQARLGSEVSLEILTQSAGVKQVAGQSEVGVAIGAQGMGVSVKAGASETGLEVGSKGNGTRVACGASEVVTAISADGMGVRVATGTGEASVNIEVEGDGLKQGLAGVLPIQVGGHADFTLQEEIISSSRADFTLMYEDAVAVSISTEGDFTKSTSGYGDTTIEVTPEVLGHKASHGQSETITYISAEGDFSKYASGHSETPVEITPIALGSKFGAGQSSAEVVVMGTGDGTKQANGYAHTSLTVSPLSSGVKIGYGESVTTIEVVAVANWYKYARGSGEFPLYVNPVADWSKHTSGAGETATYISTMGAGVGYYPWFETLEFTVTICSGVGLSARFTSELEAEVAVCRGIEKVVRIS